MTSNFCISEKFINLMERKQTSKSIMEFIFKWIFKKKENITSQLIRKMRDFIEIKELITSIRLSEWF